MGFLPTTLTWFATTLSRSRERGAVVERFGDEFFRALPSGPGVYFMCGATEGVLYVGKARNLRKRLSRLTRSRPLARPSRAFTFGRIPFAVSQTAQVRVAIPPPRRRYGGEGPERLPRRIIRLLHRVTRIEFDVCPTEEAARKREEPFHLRFTIDD